LRPIPIKDRASIVFPEYGELDVLDSAFVLVDRNGVRVQIPVGGIASLMLEPGTRVSHAAVVLAARVACLLVWVGEGGSAPSRANDALIAMRIDRSSRCDIG
jgi:CRISP-associated protein Cas1